MRRRRTTRPVDEWRVGGGVVTTAVREWPGLTGPSIWTFEGRMEQRQAIVDNLRYVKGTKPLALASLFLLAAGLLLAGGVTVLRLVF